MSEKQPHLAEIDNLSVEFHTRYGVVHAVKNVSWHIDRGESLAIVGESGSGKSVTADALMGLLDSPPGYITSGRVLYRGTDLSSLSDEGRRDLSGRKIAMIFQDTLAALNPVYPVGWQVAETCRAHGTDSREALERALHLLDRVGIPDARRRAKDYPHQFSGGQRQRIMIAMAVALKPDLLIADEPTTALDVTVQAQILRLLKELQQETGMGLLLITHDMGVVAQVAERTVVMNRGEIVESGETRQVFGFPNHEYTKKLVDAMPGRHPVAESRRIADDSNLLRVRDLSKHYGAFKALDGVSFDLKEGEAIGIVGESGSGKSTLAGTLLGIQQADGGTAEYRGRNILRLSRAEQMAIRRRVQVVFQDPTASLNPRMTVEEIISEPWVIHRDVLPRSEWRSRVAELLEHVGLSSDIAKRHPHQFSGGQRQRIAIARALALQPELIICDEAVSALDVSVQARIIKLLKKLQSEFNLSYLFIAHDLPVVRDFANRVLVMNRGKIVESGTTDQIFARPEHPYTRELLAASPTVGPNFEVSFSGSEPSVAG